MFDIGWSELVLIGIVALIAIGPKELPGALRTLGQWTGKLRRMAAEFQGQFHEAMREAEMADLKKQVDEMTSEAQSYANFDPIGEVRKELESTQQQIESAISEPPAELPGSPAAAPAPDLVSPATDASPAASPPAPGGEPAAIPSADAPAAVPSSAPAAPAVATSGHADAGGKPA